MTRTALMFRVIARTAAPDIDLRVLFIDAINRASRDLINSFSRS